MKSEGLVDDLRAQVVGALKEIGYNVIGEATSGAQAASLTSQTAADVVLLPVGWRISTG